VVHPDDEEGRAVLEDAYPGGQLILKQSATPERDYYLFMAPAEEASETEETPLEE
jgi:hypothetical protein